MKAVIMVLFFILQFTVCFASMVQNYHVWNNITQ